MTIRNKSTKNWWMAIKIPNMVSASYTRGTRHPKTRHPTASPSFPGFTLGAARQKIAKPNFVTPSISETMRRRWSTAVSYWLRVNTFRYGISASPNENSPLVYSFFVSRPPNPQFKHILFRRRHVTRKYNKFLPSVS